MIKVIFLGTPSIGASALESLLNNKEIEVVAVVTGEDKPIGRSHSELVPSPVAVLATENNLNLIKTNSINKDIDKIKDIEVDYLLTCAFGQFLSDEVLALPKYKALNIHGSLLPKGRGGAPLHWAIINGEKETGISIMEMVSKMDAGDYYSQYKIDIKDTDTVDDLFINMSNLIAKESANGLLDVHNGAEAIKQDESQVTFWMNVKREDAKVDWTKSNIDVYNQIRGLTSKPGAWTTLDGKVVKINKATIGKETSNSNPGTVESIGENYLEVSTSNGTIHLHSITIEGSKPKDITIEDNNFINKQFN